ncbi:hypothetical protein DTG53_22655, partial [Salmonella enterica subsp. houtenae]|nr:hypothetical protein [Salmonella enterica subsp. houtenae]
RRRSAVRSRIAPPSLWNVDKKYFRVYLKGFTAKFCSLKIWIKLKIETQNNVTIVRESLNYRNQKRNIFGL